MIVMGCLLELFFEIFVEGVLELIGHCYLKLMLLIVPSKTVTAREKKVLKNTVTTIAGILALVTVIGVILLIQDDPILKGIGRYMTYIPLTIMALQISLGVIMKLIGYFRK